MKTLTMPIKYQLLLFMLVFVRLFLCCPPSSPILMAHVLDVTLGDNNLCQKRFFLCLLIPILGSF